MKSIHHDVWRRGGLAKTYELLRDGHTSHQLTAAVRRGDVIRTRQGHYACPELSQAEIEASRVGGRLTGLSGAQHHGIWTPNNGDLEVAVRADARALRSRDDKSVRLATVNRPGVAVTWSDHDLVGTRSAVNPMSCLLKIVRSQPEIVAFVAVESALFRGIVTQAGWARQFRRVAERRRGELRQVSRLSESGGESMLKFHLLQSGIRFTQQVKMTGVGRVDFLLGERLVVEVDGAEFHTSKEAFEEDRRRDAALSIRGYRVLRFSYRQIADRADEVMAAIIAALSRGDHLE